MMKTSSHEARPSQRTLSIPSSISEARLLLEEPPSLSMDEALLEVFAESTEHAVSEEDLPDSNLNHTGKLASQLKADSNGDGTAQRSVPSSALRMRVVPLPPSPMSASTGVTTTGESESSTSSQSCNKPLEASPPSTESPSKTISTANLNTPSTPRKPRLRLRLTIQEESAHEKVIGEDSRPVYHLQSPGADVFDRLHNYGNRKARFMRKFAHCRSNSACRTHSHSPPRLHRVGSPKAFSTATRSYTERKSSKREQLMAQAERSFQQSHTFIPTLSPRSELIALRSPRSYTKVHQRLFDDHRALCFTRKRREALMRAQARRDIWRERPRTAPSRLGHTMDFSEPVGEVKTERRRSSSPRQRSLSALEQALFENLHADDKYRKMMREKAVSEYLSRFKLHAPIKESEAKLQRVTMEYIAAHIALLTVDQSEIEFHLREAPPEHLPGSDLAAGISDKSVQLTEVAVLLSRIGVFGKLDHTLHPVQLQDMAVFNKLEEALERDRSAQQKEPNEDETLEPLQPCQISARVLLNALTVALASGVPETSLASTIAHIVHTYSRSMLPQIHSKMFHAIRYMRLTPLPQYKKRASSQTSFRKHGYVGERVPLTQILRTVDRLYSLKDSTERHLERERLKAIDDELEECTFQPFKKEQRTRSSLHNSAEQDVWSRLFEDGKRWRAFRDELRQAGEEMRERQFHENGRPVWPNINNFAHRPRY